MPIKKLLSIWNVFFAQENMALHPPERKLSRLDVVLFTREGCHLCDEAAELRAAGVSARRAPRRRVARPRAGRAGVGGGARLAVAFDGGRFTFCFL